MIKELNVSDCSAWGKDSKVCRTDYFLYLSPHLQHICMYPDVSYIPHVAYLQQWEMT